MHSRLHCDRIYQNVLLPNGDVVLCCMDWSAEHVLGNNDRMTFFWIASDRQGLRWS